MERNFCRLRDKAMEEEMEEMEEEEAEEQIGFRSTKVSSSGCC